MKNNIYNWENFLSFSKKLYDSSFGKDDLITKYRIIVSRSYYAAFHYGQDFLKENHLQKDRCCTEHQAVILDFQEMKKKTQDFQRKCKSIGLKLKRLKVRRVRADYEADCMFEEEDAKYGIKEADEIISKIDELKNDLAR